jgi:hypothetical protein
MSAILDRLAWWDKISQLVGLAYSGRTWYAIEQLHYWWTNNHSGLRTRRQVLMIGGTWLGVKFFGMSYGGLYNVSCKAKELGACGIPETLYGSEDGFKVLKIFTKQFPSM